MTTAILIVLGIVIGVICDRAYLDSKEADRLEKLKGAPMPKRRNESGAWFPWGEQ